MGNRWFIVDFTVADYVTLTGLVLVWTALWCALSGRVELAIALLTVAMLLDALDGMLARKLGIARPFGRFVGSFVDLLNYTVGPPLILRSMGYDSWPALGIMLLYSTCGLLRLARFNEVGNIQDEKGALAYLGLPVFWIHFLLMGLYGIHRGIGEGAFWWTATLTLPLLSLGFVLNRPFWKPQDYGVIAAVTLGAALFFGWLGLR